MKRIRVEKAKFALLDRQTIELYEIQDAATKIELFNAVDEKGGVEVCYVNSETEILISGSIIKWREDSGGSVRVIILKHHP